MNQLSDLKSPTISNSEVVHANYNKLSDHIRRLTPQGIQCSVFCGGINCKYENPENWKPDSLAIQGIYSHWITDDILAMARPSTTVIVQKNVIQQFESLGIKSIINLQCPREHASCGQPLESSGFSYEPNIFMEHNIYYYNFTWKDYGDATLDGLLNMVKVLAFALTEGRVAVHCHAGLGRTGVLIACYLVYSLRVKPNDAIRFVRLKRPGSVQTRGQILCVRHFGQFILPQTVTYFIRDNMNKDKYMNEFTLHKFLKRQKVVLHGYDERQFKNLPKIVFVICERILKLCACWVDDYPPSNIPCTQDFLTEKINNTMKRHESTLSISSPTTESLFNPTLSAASTPSSPNPSEIGDSCSELSTLDGDEMSEELLIENRCFQELETQKNYNQEQSEEEIVVQDLQIVVKAILTDFSKLDSETKLRVRTLQEEINTSHVGWAKLSLETNIFVLISLLFEWIESLKSPVCTRVHFESIVVLYNQPEACLEKFTPEELYFIEYLLRFLSKLNPISNEVLNQIIIRFIGVLSHHVVIINGIQMSSGKGFKRIGDGTFSCTLKFMQSLYELIENHHNNKQTLYSIADKSDNESDDGFH